MSDEPIKNPAISPVPPKITPTGASTMGATIRLKPVTPPGVVAAARSTSRISVPDLEKPVAAAGVNPAPFTTVAPLSPETAQALQASASKTQTAPIAAAKSKTSRIALDEVIGVTSAPLSSGGTGGTTEEVKTIRLKRPAALGAVKPAGAPTPQEIPDSEMTQKKTIKMKRPGLAVKSGESAAAESADGELELQPLSQEDLAAFAAGGATGAPDNKALSVIAILAASVAIIVSLLTICATGAQALNTNVQDQPQPNANTLHSIDAPSLPWAK